MITPYNSNGIGSTAVLWPSLRSPIDCIIPAKGHSVRFPRKVLGKVDGVPLIGYVIEAARLSRVFGRIVVATDDDEIGEVARAFGADVVRRPPDLSARGVMVQDVVRWTLDRLDEEYATWGVGKKSYIAILHATAALLTPGDLSAMYRLLAGNDQAQGIFSVVKPAEHPSEALVVGEDGWLRTYFIDEARPSEEYVELWSDAGMAYMYQVAALREHGQYPPRLLGHELPRSRVVDVNYPDDLKMVRALLHIEKEEGQA